MPRIELDFRFVEADYEVWAVEEYLKALEDQLKFLPAQLPVRTRAELSERGLRWEDPEVQLRYQELNELLEELVSIGV